VMILVINVKHCDAADQRDGGRVSVNIARLPDQPLDETQRIGFSQRLAQSAPDYVQVQLDAGSGPLGTRDYRIELEGIPAGAGRSFLHLHYGYTDSFPIAVVEAKDEGKPAVAGLEQMKRYTAAPLHIHLSEQRAENEACLAVHGRTPTELLAAHGLLTHRLTAVHATHLTDRDRTALGAAGTSVCFCPTTERDLADGIGDAGPKLSLGSDSHAIIDLFEEARAVELNLRLKTERRGHFTAHALLRGATNHASLGWDDAGRIEPGALADLVTVGLDSPRLETAEPDTLLESIVFAASAADVTQTIIGGQKC